MSSMRIFRIVAGKTQAELAKRLNTTQQTYARWESGVSRVPDEALSELASIYSTTVEKLIQRKPSKKPKVISSASFDRPGRCWGHLCVRLPTASSTICFAITSVEAEKVRGSLRSHQIPEWIMVHTLDNRVLAIRPKQVRVWLVDEADEWPKSDWKQPTTWGSGFGVPLGQFKAMAAWADQQQGGDTEFDQLPVKQRREALAIIKQSGFSSRPDDLAAALRTTVIHFTDGTTEAFELQRSNLIDLFKDLDGIVAPEMMALIPDDQCFEAYFPTAIVCMVEMPLVELAFAQEEMVDQENVELDDARTRYCCHV